MKRPTDIGKNRTGIDLRRAQAAETLRGAEEGGVSLADPTELIQMRAQYASESPPVGTMPPPSTMKGAAKTILGILKGEKATVFLDKLGERLAFERAGTRLYDALLIKLEAADPHPGGPSRRELEKIRADEHRHFIMLVEAIRKLGGDPTAVTPCADVTAVASCGLPQVLTDSRTTLTQCLSAILTAELVDNDGWELLSDTAEKLGQADLAENFREALAEEAEHLQQVRGWFVAAVQGEAGIPETTRMAAPRSKSQVVKDVARSPSARRKRPKATTAQTRKKAKRASASKSSQTKRSPRSQSHIST